MKILHVIPALAKGGAERVVTDLANHAAKHGNDVTVLAGYATGSDQRPAPLHPNVTLRFIAQRGLRTRSVYPLLPVWMIRNRAWLLEQDVVHCHLAFGSVFAVALQTLRLLTGGSIPAIVETNHLVGMAVSKQRREFQAWLLSSRDGIAFMAEDAYWTRYRLARPHRLFRTIPNGVTPPGPIGREASDRYRCQVAQITPDAFVLGSVGRLVRERRPDLLMDAFIRITRLTDRNVHLLLAGEGPERHHLQAQARSAGIADRVHMPGLIVNPIEALGTIDLYLTINIGAITGIAALEAASAGLPVVAIQLNSFHQRGEADWIWSSPDPQEFAAWVIALIDDPGRLKCLAEKQRAFARVHHSDEAMADAYQRFYEEVLTARRVGNDSHE